MIKGLWILMLLVVGGCRRQAMNDELANKPEYSVLQAYEYQYRDVKNDKPYLVFENALKTDATVVAFPIKNKTTGYVVMLAETKTVPKVKAMPDVDFVVSQRAFIDVRSVTPLSKEVEQFIAQHIR
jgi:hypothetical protein